jgi:hypothetical protein
MSENRDVTAEFRLLGLLSDRPVASSEAAPPAPAQWTSVLGVPGAIGNVDVNGASTTGVGRAPAMLQLPENGQDIRVSGVLATATGRPGTWRFERQGGAGGAMPLKVLEGQVALVTPDAIVFRLRGHAGERVSFALTRVP